jgi:hypothetical protein
MTHLVNRSAVSWADLRSRQSESAVRDMTGQEAFRRAGLGDASPDHFRAARL